ncbi:FtsX-like permease family protein [Actinomadura namibiensis]|uniref:Putative ABC transport system permease protein n=1 Tax=Actinomadura namibiensis TaxID=182080 RepID=A0A7W3LPN5_ACTNM|nr:FtsX-like permease family protein [Actinomadura namibiensis]MBA8951969.1 putative ABC transport system permease protein [Actinomadura namibiensis]
MTVFGLAVRTLRHRAGGFAAVFLAMVLGATILMAFASMLDIATGDVPGAARETLVIMATVVGGWGMLLVAFAVVSTLTLAVRQRAAEIALLKSVGATPAQLTRMIVGEAVALAVVSVALAVAPAALAGRGLLALLHDTGQVPADVGYAFGPIALAQGFGITLVASVVAAYITARRTTRARVAESLVSAEVERPRMSKKRIVAGGLFLALGLDLAIVTVTAMRNAGQETMATAGQAAIFASFGLAVLAPGLVRGAARLAGGVLERCGAAGDLALASLRGRTGQAASVVTPIILFTGIGTGTLYVQATENAVVARSGLAPEEGAETIETLNLVVIGMIVAFTALMLVNTLLAATAHRRREFGQLRLAGAAPGQVLGAVALEGAVLMVTGVLAGTVASVFTILPFTAARADALVPDGGPGIYAGTVAVAAALTLVTVVGATRRALRVPAVEAVAV